jgi:hypothetical protein
LTRTAGTRECSQSTSGLVARFPIGVPDPSADAARLHLPTAPGQRSPSRVCRWHAGPRHGLVDLVGARRRGGGLAVQQQPHGGDGAAERHGRGGSTAATFTVTTNPVAKPQSSSIIGTAGGATRSATLTVRTEFQATNGSVLLARGGTGAGRVTSQPAGSTVSSPRPGPPAAAATSFSRPAPRSGWRPVLPRARAFWAGSSRPPVGTPPRSRWPLGWPTSAAGVQAEVIGPSSGSSKAR